jgi:hypothetical protein
MDNILCPEVAAFVCSESGRALVFRTWLRYCVQKIVGCLYPNMGFTYYIYNMGQILATQHATLFWTRKRLHFLDTRTHTSATTLWTQKRGHLLSTKTRSFLVWVVPHFASHTPPRSGSVGRQMLTTAAAIFRFAWQRNGTFLNGVRVRSRAQDTRHNSLQTSAEPGDRCASVAMGRQPQEALE